MSENKTTTKDENIVTAVEQPKENIVQIDKAEYESLKSQVSLLTQVADQGRLSKLRQKTDIKEKHIRVSTYHKDNTKEPQLVIGWKLLKDSVVIPGKGAVQEDQVVQIILEDGSTVQMQYLRFVKDIIKVSVLVESTTTDKEGNVFLHFKYNGKDQKLGVAYVN